MPNNQGFADLVMDAIELARNFAADIKEHPLYVYYTALPLCASDSTLYRHFHDSRFDPSVFTVHRQQKDGADPAVHAYSSDGRRYAVANETSIVVMKTATNQKLLSIPTPPAGGTYAAARDQYAQNVYMYDMYYKSSNDYQLPKEHWVTFSYDGSLIAAASGPVEHDRSWDRNSPTLRAAVHVWNSTSGALEFENLTHSESGFVSAVAWSPDGERLASAVGSEMIVWNVSPRQGHRLSTMKHSCTVTSIAFSSDGSKVTSCSAEGHLVISDSIRGSILQSLQVADYIHARVGRHTTKRVTCSSKNMGEYLLVRTGDGQGREARDPSSGDLLSFPRSLADAVGFSGIRGSMVNLLYRRTGKYLRWDYDESLEWGPHGEYLTCLKDKDEAYVVIFPKWCTCVTCMLRRDSESGCEPTAELAWI